MHISRLAFGFALATLACSRLPDQAIRHDDAVAEIATRPPPPIYASHCAGLTPEERRETEDFLSKLTWVEPKYRDDATARFHQQSLSENPTLLIGVNLYLPAERGLNRAYLERLLSCHALQPARASDHPNDPLLAPNIMSVDVEEADGGQYRISIVGARREDGELMLQRARALQQPAGSVRVQQLAAPAP